MSHYAKYFLTPALVPTALLGPLLGGAWLWLGIAVVALLVVGGDTLLGNDPSEPRYRHPWILEIPLQLALPLLTLLLLALAWSAGPPPSDFLGIGALTSRLTGIDALAARERTLWWHYVGGCLSIGFIVAGYGTNVAHELCHRVGRRRHVVVGRWLLAMSGNADFSIEHVYGHHARVGTPADPASARRGENVYAFFLRSTIGGHLSAWCLERARLRRRGKSVVSRHNQILTGYAMSLLWIALFYVAAGRLGIALFLAQALVAKFVLEVVNYMEHYGLTRRPGEKVLPKHSWNTNRRMSAMILYSLTRHSAHHESGTRPFWSLPAYPHAPEMPHGYLTTLVICLVPPLWRRVIDPRLTEWHRRYAAAAA